MFYLMLGFGFALGIGLALGIGIGLVILIIIGLSLKGMGSALFESHPVGTTIVVGILLLSGGIFLLLLYLPDPGIFPLSFILIGLGLLLTIVPIYASKRSTNEHQNIELLNEFLPGTMSNSQVPNPKVTGEITNAKVCPKCGIPNDETASFCKKCGQRIE